MKRFILAAILLAAGAAGAAAQEGLVLTPQAGVELSVGNYFRGASAGLQIGYDFGGIMAGLEAKFLWDAGLSNVNVPVYVMLGIGRDFWLLAGHEIALSTPTLTSGSSSVEVKFGAFPNSYGLGFNYGSVDLGFANLKIGTEIFYTISIAGDGATLDSLVYGLAAAFAGLRATVFAALELKL